MCDEKYFEDEYYYGDVPYDYDEDYDDFYYGDIYPVAPMFQTEKVVYLTAEQILADDINRAHEEYMARVLIEEAVMEEILMLVIIEELNRVIDKLEPRSPYAPYISMPPQDDGLDVGGYWNW